MKQSWSELDTKAQMNKHPFWGDELAFRCGHRTGVIEGIHALAKYLNDNPQLLQRNILGRICSNTQAISVKDVPLMESNRAMNLVYTACVRL